MKRFLMSAVSIGAVCIATQSWAADVAQFDPVYDWTGFYVGGQVGMSSGAMRVGPIDVDDGLDGVFVHGDLTQTLAGVHAGYNQQINNIVLGLEGDVNAAAGEGFFQPAQLRTVSPWNAGLRARVGLLATPRSLLYTTGGLAFGTFKTKGNEPGSPEVLGGSRVGWTLGGGLEYALDSNWTSRIEYRYTDWGSKTVDFDGQTAKSELSDHRIGVGLSYKFGGDGHSSGDGSANSDVYDWTGLYLGRDVGTDAGQLKAASNSSGDFGHAGFNQILAGGYLGYNYELVNGLVAGIEGDLNYKAGGGWMPLGHNRPTSDWDGSIRARIGLSPTPRSLVYGTGGIAFGHFTTPLHEVDSGDESELLGGNRTGWTIGSGIEYALDSNWSTRIEYRYTDWGSKAINLAVNDETPDPGKSKLYDSRIMVGVSYKMGEATTFPGEETGPTDWTGFNLGGQVGATAAHFSYTDVTDASNKEFADFTQSFVGGHVGYDYQMQSLVLGVVGDLNSKMGHGFKFDDLLRPTSQWDGSIRGRLGWAATDHALIYGTGGIAFGHFSTPQTGAQEPNDPAEEHLGGSRTGWTIGSGVDYALDSKWSTGLEYRYTDWGTKTVTNLTDTDCGDGCPETAKSRLTDSRISVGFSYKF